MDPPLQVYDAVKDATAKKLQTLEVLRSMIDVQGNELAQNVEEQCTVCMGPPGDDSRRCERKAFPLHRTHLVDGVYYLPTNTDEINAEIERNQHDNSST